MGCSVYILLFIVTFLLAQLMHTSGSMMVFVPIMVIVTGVICVRVGQRGND